MVPQDRRPPPELKWAYVYRMAGSYAASRLETIELLLAGENAAARRGDRTWNGRVVVEPEITYLLIVTDTPDQDREINRRLEAELIGLEAEFSITLPLTIPPVAPQAD